MRAVFLVGCAAGLLAVTAGPAAAEEYKGAVLKKMDLDLKSSPAKRVIIFATDKGKDLDVQFGKDMKVYGTDGKEVPRGELARVFTVGNVIDLKTAKEGDREVIAEARLVKKKGK